MIEKQYFGVNDAIEYLLECPCESLQTVIDGYATHVTLVSIGAVVLETLHSDITTEITIEVLRADYASNDFRVLDQQEYGL